MRPIRMNVSCGKLWQLLCTGKRCPHPGSGSRVDHLQPTWQRATANMVAHNCREVRPGACHSVYLLESICKSWTVKTAMTTIVYRHTVTCSNCGAITIYMPCRYSLWETLWIDSLTVNVFELFMTQGRPSFIYLSLHHLTSVIWGNDKSQYLKGRTMEQHCSTLCISSIDLKSICVETYLHPIQKHNHYSR